MDKQLNFKFKARLANLFGTELVSSPSVALGELVKNSYDADATEIILTFRNIRKPGGTIIIEDNGEGMNADDLEQKWMVIGTQDKQEHPVSNLFKRRKVGEKGIGRFAVQRLGHKVLLKSKRQGEKTWNCLTINWDDYDRSSGLFDAISNDFHQEPASTEASGVIVTLENVREAWDEHSFNQLRKDLYLLFSPFREEEQNFKVLVIADEFPSYMQDLESHIECVTKDVGPTTSGGFAPEDRLDGDQTEDEEQTPLLKRYHELVDKQMLESLSTPEKEELDAIKIQLDEIDESNETLQRAEVQMDAKRRLLDEQLGKISGQLKALLEQM